MTGLPDGYYAAIDHADPTTTTYWRVHGGTISIWPRGARPGPTWPLKRDAPADLDERLAWHRDWRDRWQAWATTVHTAIEGDPGAARRAFVSFKVRCWMCGRPLFATAHATQQREAAK
ncbi:hypothetical protein [Streptomyces albipurpureus]|uniref:Uncharacterized protein n=1 Tax=Streptomyces albipurpureus TaxID=2897419 RepID=A0ABT0US02_9ACTN|nr:hypothetical protein [Streptomyces sp. CWNU-1]MCM2390173.1 hypothetical protein [Streptomyces sp. CWNU-1]